MPTEERYSLRITVQPEQAKQLAIQREQLARELLQVQKEIQNWEAGMGWLPEDQMPLHVRTLRERWHNLKAKFDWIDRQLALTPPPDESSDHESAQALS
jgi:hypothetical protein